MLKCHPAPGGLGIKIFQAGVSCVDSNDNSVILCRFQRLANRPENGFDGGDIN